MNCPATEIQKRKAQKSKQNKIAQWYRADHRAKECSLKSHRSPQGSTAPRLLTHDNKTY